MPSTDTRFLLKRMLRLIGMADDLVTTSTGTPEEKQQFDALKREIETLNAHLQNTHLENSPTP